MKYLLISMFFLLLLNKGMSQCPLAVAFNANPTQGCATPHTVFFTDQSTLPDTWFWQFGDGGTSTAQNPIHTYTTTGTFTVTLTITDTVVGCVDQTSQTVSVSIPTADFNASTTSGCLPLSVDFTNTSLSNGSSISSWDWDFGDGNSSTQENPNHIYNQPGSYTVSLTIVDDNGCSKVKTVSNLIQVNGPVVDFTANTLSACGSLLVDFTDNTTYTAPASSWSWDFGDGNTSSDQNPSHLFSTSGSFDIALTITDDDGCVQSHTIPQYIDVLPHASGTDVLTACDSITWIDGVTYTSSNNSATHNIIGGAANGCDSLVTLDLTINSVSDITTTQNATTITANNSNATYQWLNCNDNFTALANETDPSFTASINGSYAVELTENGCVDTSDCITISSVGISEIYSSDGAKIFPNPTRNGDINIQLQNQVETVQLDLYSVTGQLIKSNAVTNTNLIQYSVGQTAGVYLLKITDPTGFSTIYRVIKE